MDINGARPCWSQNLSLRIFPSTGMSTTGLSSLLAGATSCKFHWSHLNKVLDYSNAPPDIVTESKYSLISSFAALLYDYGDIGVSSPNRLLIFQYLLTAITFDDEVSSHIPKPGILFWMVEYVRWRRSGSIPCHLARSSSYGSVYFVSVNIKQLPWCSYQI